MTMATLRKKIRAFGFFHTYSMAHSCTDNGIDKMSRASSPARSAGEQELGENDEIDIEQLITLMHRRPPLWDKFDAKYHDRVLKARLWEEIYKQIYFTWEQCSVAERKQKGN